LSFLREDWKSSICGVAAIDACFKFSLLEEAIDAFSITDVSGKGIYLYENQGWERALTYLWQKKCSQEIYGFQHVSGKFFDLRPYDGFEGGAYVEAPLPDKIIVTGESAYKSLEQFGYPTKKLVIAESLRNLYLGKLDSVERSSEIRTLLVVTDYLKQATDYQLRILTESWEAIERNFSKVIVKPHPNCPVDEILSKYGIAREAIIDVDNRSLDKIWCEVDVVFASNVTGAALESAYIALPTLVSLSADSFNMSPLRGIKGVSFVCSGENIEKVLTDLTSPELPCNYLCLNQSLRLWEALLRN
jgi:surface carbohydrate biosynthesis protein (TIGR04326 family)